MHYLFEQSDSLNSPIECFIFDTSAEVFPVRPHWHYFAEIILVFSGTAQIHCSDKIFTLSEGEMAIFHPRAVHSIYSADGMQLRYGVFKFDLNRLGTAGSYIHSYSGVFKCAEKANISIVFSESECEMLNCKKIFDICINECYRRTYGYDAVIRSQIHTLLIGIIRCWLSQGLAIDSNVLAHKDHFTIDTVTKYIDRASPDKLRVENIAAQCGLSYSCFAKKFRELYGMSCKEYIEQMRIYKAEELLMFTDFDLNYISQETGFSDCSHMIKSFRKYRGCTPNSFRHKPNNAIGAT
ncbi:MAG: AraC family transcriptional regulator [Oscillospiraceae bacterium]|nr:AraC family transcriptional regulator [Oscillospiraceae bacterium]